MDADYPVERHLLTRCYTSDDRILEILQTRYAGSEAAAVPFLALVPTSTETPAAGEKNEPHLHQNLDRKPNSSRKLNIRKDMRVYIKKTMSNQKKAVSKLRLKEKTGENFIISELFHQFKIPLYDQYLALNRLWQNYMHELLFSDLNNPDVNTILPRLSSADYNGCNIKVLEARDCNIVGMEGIVIFDAQHLFIVVVPQKNKSDRNLSPAERIGGIRLLKKKGTLFGFSVKINQDEYVDFTILGSRFELRAVDRTAKKFKSHKVEDIY